MSDLRKAAEMALEALVSSTGELRIHLASPTDAQLEKNYAAIEILRQALAQPEPVQFKCTVVDDGHPNGVPLSQWGRQPEQEPAAWVSPNGIVVDKQGLKFYNSTVGTKFVGKQLYTAPPSIEAAVLAEREACAKVAENTDRMVLALLNVTSQPEHIAAAIRARSEK